MAPKSVLITGCSEGGIGDALAREFHARGLTVFATARTPARMDPHLTAREGITTLPLDVTSPASIAHAVETVREATAGGGGGGLDILVNNAGVTQMRPFLDSSLADLKQVLDTNLYGVFAVTHAFLPLLIQKSSSNGGSSLVVNIGSITEVLSPRFHLAYTASKTALFSFSRILRVEVAPLGVQVVHIKTGGVKSRIIEKQSVESTTQDNGLSDQSSSSSGSSSSSSSNSYYAPVRDVIEGGVRINQAKMTDTDVYAKQVVDELLGNPRPVLWIGYLAWLARLLSFFSWAGILDWLYMKQDWGRRLRETRAKDKIV